MLHHHLGGVPDRAGRTVYHSRAFREAEARYPAAPAGPGLGEGEPAAPAARQPGARPRAQGRTRRGRAAPRLARRRDAAPPPAAPPVPARGTAARCCCGLLCLLAHHRPLRGLALGAAPRDRRPDARRHRGASSGSTPALIVALVAVEGVFRYQMRMILIGLSREIEYELRNDLFAHLTRLAAALLPAQPHRRPDEPRHQRPVRGAHGARAPGSCTRPAPSPPSWAPSPLMLAHQPAARCCSSLVPLVLRLVAGAPLRPPHPRPLRGGAGAARRASTPSCRRTCPGARVVRAYAQERARAGALRRGQPGVRAAQPAPHPHVRQPLPGHPAPDGRWAR